MASQPALKQHDSVSGADAVIGEMAKRARAAAVRLATTGTAARAAALMAAARELRERSGEILRANADDMAAGASAGLSPAMLDRLRLDDARVAGIASALEAVAHLPDPVGTVIDRSVRPNGLALERVRIPIGVIGIIYESRPNVTADAAGLCLMSGNAVILRGGSEAARSNHAIHAGVAAGIADAGLPEDCVQMVPDQDRALVGAMLRAHGAIDMIIPRGGKTLVARVQTEARVPVLAHLDGNNHVYIAASADPAMAQAIVVNAKMRRTGICGAAETILADAAFPEASAVIAALIDAGCTVRGDERICALDRRVETACDADWGTEFLDAVVAMAMVDGPDAAMSHIAQYGSGHTDAIVTADAIEAERFLASVDSAIVLWNASTQFADGGEFGLGAEIGIGTGRLHARGPVALEGLTTHKWVVRGTGQIRP